jgi:type IV pilus assembly protein PilX
VQRPILPLDRLPNRSRQTGAVLVVGLVLLLVLTVIGVSGMNTATMEIQMAGNTQFQQDSFQAAEDAIDLALGPRDYTTEEDREVAWLGTPERDRYSQTVYKCPTPAPNYSASDFDAFHFETVAVGRGPRNSPSTHTQGFYVVASHIPVVGGCL